MKLEDLTEKLDDDVIVSVALKNYNFKYVLKVKDLIKVRRVTSMGKVHNTIDKYGEQYNGPGKPDIIFDYYVDELSDFHKQIEDYL